MCNVIQVVTKTLSVNTSTNQKLKINVQKNQCVKFLVKLKEKMLDLEINKN